MTSDWRNQSALWMVLRRLGVPGRSERQNPPSMQYSAFDTLGLGQAGARTALFLMGSIWMGICMFESLAKILLSPVDVAISVVADTVTLGGALTEEEKPYTAQAAERLMDNVDDVFDPKGK